MNLDSNLQIWERSKNLSQPYWTFYQRLIGLTNFTFNTTDPFEQESRDNDSEQDADSESDSNNVIINCDDDDYDGADDEENDDHDVSENEDAINPEYLEFIRTTRKHQAERDRLKQLELKKKPELDVEEYYKDISQVNTLVEDNLVEAPNKDDGLIVSRQKHREESLIKLYGGREAFEKIRSMEMSIDENFNKKFQELSPKYWPAMPLNPKPYLNPIIG